MSRLINKEFTECMFSHMDATGSLMHIRQKERIALEIAVNVAGVSGPSTNTTKCSFYTYREW
jgi:hypothetical protein